MFSGVSSNLVLRCADLRPLAYFCFDHLGLQMNDPEERMASIANTTANLTTQLRELKRLRAQLWREESAQRSRPGKRVRKRSKTPAGKFSQ
jgi:hypothetical protein